MIRSLFIAAGVITAVASWSSGAPARAETMCSALPNPLVVTGSADFEPVLAELAVKLAVESPATTIVTVAVGSQTRSCAGVRSVVEATDFGGLPGRSYSRNGTTIATSPCTFASGQTADVAISEVFYETCTNVPQPRPAGIADLLGPVQPVLFVGSKANTGDYLSHDEARSLFGCGVSSARPVAGRYNDPTWVFCRDAAAGTQMTIARNLSLADSALPGCRFFNADSKLIVDLVVRDDPATTTVVEYVPPPSAIGFSSAGAFDRQRTALNQIAFQAPGQTKAFHADSSKAVFDRRNVRDGHYPIWGYIHFIARTSGGNVSPRVSELVGWINGTKTSAGIDAFDLSLKAGLIPQCAMKVKRSADGGLLSPFTPPKACHCAFEAQSAQIIPPGCVPCASASACTGGLTCQHGFCD
jgi:ABC-type phosphate transport system substrate-binding protein